METTTSNSVFAFNQAVEFLLNYGIVPEMFYTISIRNNNSIYFQGHFDSKISIKMKDLANVQISDDGYIVSKTKLTYERLDGAPETIEIDITLT